MGFNVDASPNSLTMLKASAKRVQVNGSMHNLYWYIMGHVDRALAALPSKGADIAEIAMSHRMLRSFANTVIKYFAHEAMSFTIFLKASIAVRREEIIGTFLDAYGTTDESGIPFTSPTVI